MSILVRRRGCDSSIAARGSPLNLDWTGSEGERVETIDKLDRNYCSGRHIGVPHKVSSIDVVKSSEDLGVPSDVDSEGVGSSSA